MKRLVIPRRNGLEGGEFLAQGLNEFSRQEIPAGFTRDEHKTLRLHRVEVGLAAICLVISKAKSRARFADSPLTLGVCFSRTH